LGKGLNHFLKKINQQFLTRDAVVDHGSYNETIYIKQKKEKEKEKDKKEKKRKIYVMTNASWMQ